MKKTIWIFHHYGDPPDGHWTGTYDLYRFLVKKGHAVTVFCSSFSHYSRADGRLAPGELYRERDYEGMRYVFIRTSPYFDNGWRRLVNVVSYAVNVLRAVPDISGRPDIIIASSPHPFGALAGLWLSRRFKARFFFELHDLWPEFLIEVGSMSRYNPVAVVMAAIEKRCLKSAERIFTLWPRMDRYIEKFGIPKERIVWVPMGVDGSLLDGNSNAPAKPDGRFIAMYAGRVGPANDLDVLLKAAKLIQDGGHRSVHFEIVGGGPEREPLMSQAADAGIKNVEFRDFMPKAELYDYMKRADVFLGSLADLPHYDRFGVISSKLIDYLAMKRPVIYATGMKSHMSQEAGAGLVVPPRNPEALAEAVLEIASKTPQERAELGARGFRYIVENHDLRKLAERVEACF